MDVDDELLPKVGRPRGAGGGAAGSPSSQLSGRLAFRPSIRLATRPGTSAAVSRADGRQRVVVKTSFRVHGSSAGPGGTVQVAGNLRAHLRYIQREAAALDREAPELQVSGAAAEAGLACTSDVVSAWSEDRHHYRLVVSPENGADLGSVAGFTRTVMDRVGEQIGRDLEWVAAEHSNTDQPHSHVVLRGVANGEELRLDRKTVSFGIREIAEEVATAELGPRTISQVREAFRAQIEVSRATELDRALHRGAEDGVVDVSRVRVSEEMRVHLVGRLRTLQTMGLASHVRGHEYRLENGFLDVLRAAEDRTLVAASAQRVFGGERGLRSFSRTSPDAEIVGRVVASGLTEGGRRAFVGIRTTEGPVYVETDPRWSPRVSIGGVVAIRAQESWPVDEEIEHQLRSGWVPVRQNPRTITGEEGVDTTRSGRAERALMESAERQVRQGHAERIEGGFRLTPEGADAIRRELNGKPTPPRVRVAAAEDPGLTLKELRWSPLDRHLLGGGAPAWPGGAEELAARADALQEGAMGSRGSDGRFMFRRGATDRLRAAELAHATAQAVRAAGGGAAAVGEERAGGWTLGGRVELAQGPGVILSRGGVTAVELLRDIRDANRLAVGDTVSVTREAGGRGVTLRPAAGSSNESEVSR